MDNSRITLLFAGDLIPPETSGCIYSDELLEILFNKDFSVVNLETPLTNSSQKVKKTGSHFRRSPDTISHVKNGFFNAVALSNNHIRDYGGQGVLETIETCKDNNIVTMGAGKNLEIASTPLLVSLKGKTIGFLNFSEKEFNIAGHNYPGANPFETIDVFYQIQSTKRLCDAVFVIFHGGVEYHYLPRPGIIKQFKFLIDAGADGVISHHTHRYSGVMEYRCKPVFFGLGNFLSSTISKVTDDWLIGAMAMISIRSDGIEYQMVPTKMARDFSSVDVLSNPERTQVMAHIDRLSSKIINDIEIKKYWDQVFQDEAGRTIALLKSGSRMEFRIRKRLRKLRSKMSFYQLSILLNLVRCDSHREKIIEILSSEYNHL